MELKNGPISLFKLILGGFKTANQAFGSVLFLFILIILLSALMTGVVMGAGFLFGPKTALVLQIPLSLLLSFFGLVFTTAVIQILGAKIEKNGLSASGSFASSLLPSVYFIISTLILAVPAAVVLAAAAFTRSALVIGLVYAALYFVLLPFIFTQHAAALRHEGPISSLRYSWELGTAYYLHVLLTLLALVGLGVCAVLGVFCLFKALAPQMPGFASAQPQMVLLMLMMKFSKIQIITGLVAFSFLYGYALLTFQAVITALFINLDYSKRAAQSRELDALAEANAAAPIPDAAGGAMPDVMVKQAAVRTQSDDDTAKQLDQVYSAQEHLARALEQEEDRMPTILFDESMAKQLAETQEQFNKQKEHSAKRKEDDGRDSIKISDKSL